MGFKSLFRRKKRGNGIAISLAGAQSLTGTTPTTVSRSPSLNYTAQIEEELKQVFKKFDANNDGKISASELSSILTSLGHTTATESDIAAMIGEVDADGDGHIDLAEFIELNTKDVDSDEVMENLREAFAVFDGDGNGVISAEELLKVMQSLGEECSIAECRRMISGVDSDGDGMIDFDEFKVMMVKGSRFDHAMVERTQSLKID